MRSGKDQKENQADYFEQLYRGCYPRLVGQLTFLLGSRAAAEDVTQETFLKLYTVPPPAGDNLAGWLKRVGARLAFNYLRGERRRKRRETAFTPEEGVVSLEDHLWREEKVRAVRQVLAGLPRRDRFALLLRYGGFTYREIAGVIGVAPTSVGTILVRAQRRFMAEYKQRIGDQ